MAQTDTHTHGHGDSMTEKAQWGRFSENTGDDKNNKVEKFEKKY